MPNYDLTVDGNCSNINGGCNFYLMIDGYRKIGDPSFSNWGDTTPSSKRSIASVVNIVLTPDSTYKQEIGLGLGGTGFYVPTCLETRCANTLPCTCVEIEPFLDILVICHVIPAGGGTPQAQPPVRLNYNKAKCKG